MQLLTSSRLKARRRCALLHHRRYDLGIESLRRADTLHFGDLVHKGLEAWWGALKDGLEDDDVYGWAMSALDAEADPFTRARAEVLLAGYHSRWIGERDEWEVIAVEAEFFAPLINPATRRPSRSFRCAGKLDVVARHRGRVVFVEHKTSGEDIGVGATYWQRLRLDGQLSMYFLGADALGHPAEAAVYDVIGKPKIDPLKATPPEKQKRKKDGTLYAAQREHDETPDEFKARLMDAVAERPERYYARGEVVRLDTEMHRWQSDLWAEALSLLDSRERTHPANPDACFAYGRACDFWPVCSGEASLDDPYLYRRNENPHPELSEVARG